MDTLFVRKWTVWCVNKLNFEVFLRILKFKNLWCMTISAENYIKIIYNLTFEQEKQAFSGEIARKLGISSAAVTDMARKLSRDGVIHYTKYKALELTKHGEKLARNVIRRHRLWESFLRRSLGLSLYEIHHESEYLEHAGSEKLLDRIEEWLENPVYDPHGDIIPDKQGKRELKQCDFRLSEGKFDKRYTVSRIAGDGTGDVLNWLENKGILPGKTIQINKKRGQIVVRIGECDVDVLDEDILKYIFIK